MIGEGEGVRFRQDESLRGVSMSANSAAQFSKVPEVTLGFIFFAIFLGAVSVQIRSKNFNAYLYWLTIVATTTVGTTIADFVDRSLGIGYFGGSTLLLACLMASLGIWRCSEGTVSVNTIVTPKAESFYWVTILFSQTLGTALGDWAADTNGLGYGGGAILFAGALAPRLGSTPSRGHRGSCCSGPLSFSRGRWERRSAICSTSPRPAAALRSAAISPRPSSAVLSSC
jgi:hypothetical protein